MLCQPGVFIVSTPLQSKTNRVYVCVGGGGDGGGCHSLVSQEYSQCVTAEQTLSGMWGKWGGGGVTHLSAWETHSASLQSRTNQVCGCYGGGGGLIHDLSAWDIFSVRH